MISSTHQNFKPKDTGVWSLQVQPKMAEHSCLVISFHWGWGVLSSSRT